MPKFFLPIQMVLLSFLSSCTTLPSTAIEYFSNRQIEYAQIIRSGPVVVFENGLGASMSSWNKVFSEIASDATVFAYNRPGYGKSDGVSTSRDGSTIVEELRALLRHKGLQPPYLLVGHSIGGIYVQLFARKYSDEVVGLVLVDSSHPTQFDGPGAVENWPLLARILKMLLTDSQKQELAAAAETGQQVLHLPALSGKPVMILSVEEKPDSESARFLNMKKADLARLHPYSHQIWVDSGHFIQDDQPEVVIKAIRNTLSMQ